MPAQEMRMSQTYTEEQIERAKKIRLVLMDVDGVLTDGKLYYFPDTQGKMIEFKGFSSHDGIGIQLCNFLSIPTGVISGRVSPATDERARILKMRYVYQGHLEKTASWQEILHDAGLAAEQAAFIGDDFPDLPLMRLAGLAIAVANARPEVKAAAHYVTEHAGGQGAVRDAVEFILKASGRYEDACRHYGIPGS